MSGLLKLSFAGHGRILFLLVEESTFLSSSSNQTLSPGFLMIAFSWNKEVHGIQDGQCDITFLVKKPSLGLPGSIVMTLMTSSKHQNSLWCFMSCWTDLMSKVIYLRRVSGGFYGDNHGFALAWFKCLPSIRQIVAFARRSVIASSSFWSLVNHVEG